MAKIGKKEGGLGENDIITLGMLKLIRFLFCSFIAFYNVSNAFFDWKLHGELMTDIN